MLLFLSYASFEPTSKSHQLYFQNMWTERLPPTTSTAGYPSSSHLTWIIIVASYVLTLISVWPLPHPISQQVGRMILLKYELNYVSPLL